MVTDTKQGKPTVATWHGDGVYSKPRTEKDGRPFQQFFVRAWIPSEKKIRVFKAGRSIKSAERLRRKILSDPEAAVRRRWEKAEEARNGLTVAQLYKTFTANYRGRGGTDYYVNVLRAVVGAIGKRLVSEVTTKTFDDYFRKRRASLKARSKAKHPSAGQSTIRKECIAAAKMFKWARQRGLVAVNPLADYDRPKEPVGAPARALTYQEEDELLALLPPLERDVVAWALDSGMRRGEILALTWSRIDRAAGVVHVVGTKTDKIRIVPLNLTDRLTAILERRPRRTTTDLVFHDREGRPLDVDRINGMLEAAMKTAGVPRSRGSLWNVLRKTWVSRFYASGGLPQDEADIAGHGMAIAMKHYRELSPTSRDRTAGLLNRKVTVARTVARNSEIA